jgi:rhodanese-related sulfurtransferase
MTSSSFLADNWYWIVAAVGSGGVLVWQQIQGAAASGLSPSAAVQMVNKEKAQIIDVCEPTEFAAGHAVGAKNVPLGQIASGKGLPSNKKTPLVVMCATGVRANKAVAELKKLGHENVQPLAGGLRAWREANLPVEKA